MNYFAHGYQYVDRPFFLIGTALPDMLGAIHRRIRIRRQQASLFLQDVDPWVREVAAGIVRHHEDDQSFHGQLAFLELSTKFSLELRELMADRKGLRAGFLGHILVELLLDACLIERHPQGAAPYYDAVEAVDPQVLEAVVSRIAEQNVARIAEFHQVFLRIRFLEDYLRDAALVLRVNQVLTRVKLETAPTPMLLDWLPHARMRVARRVSELTRLDTEPATRRKIPSAV